MPTWTPENARLIDSLIRSARAGLRRIEGDYPVWEMAKVHHRTEKNWILEFDDRPFLEGIYKVWHGQPHHMQVSVKKAPQEGISEWALCTAFTFAGEFGASIFYVLPKYELRNAFVKSRVNRTVQHTQRYSERLQQAPQNSDSLQLKLIGPSGCIVFPSANVEADFVALPADIGFIDEIDRCLQDHLGLLDDRLSGKKSWGVKVHVSSPTLKGHGISDKFEQSDQREWFVPCPNCHEYQELDWWKHVMQPGPDGEWGLIDTRWRIAGERDIHAFCEFCGHILDRNVRGEWKATAEARNHPGFHISKLFSGAQPITIGYDLWRRGQIDPDVLQLFYNSYLGMEYDAPGSGISEDLLEMAGKIDPYRMPEGWVDSRTTAGIDVGKVCHIRVSRIEGGNRRALYIGTVPLDEQDVINLLDQYNVGCAVIDAGPETMLVANLKARLNINGPIRIWSCTYTDQALRERSIMPEQARVAIHRTYAMDMSFADFRARRNLIPTDWRHLDGGGFFKQMCAPKRIPEMRNGEPFWVWRAGSKNDADHHRHADTYDWIASTLRPPESTADYALAEDVRSDRRFTNQEAAVPDRNPGFGIGGTGGGRVFG